MSKLSDACFAVGSSGSSAGHGPPGRNGFLHFGHVSFRVRMYMCSCFTGTSSPQCGQTFATGIRLSCVSVAMMHHAEAQGVGAVAVDDVERVDAVALRLAHVSPKPSSIFGWM